jgi:glycosyltransferase involved in cell wall biosynthesis
MTSEIKKNKVEEKVFIIPPQPPEKVADFVMSADIGANLIKRESKAQDFQSPWKLFEYCLGGLAIISTDLPFHKKIYSKYKVGLLCDTNNSPVSIAESINNLITDNVLYTEAQENARFAVENEFNWKNQELKLLKLYKEVLGE